MRRFVARAPERIIRRRSGGPRSRIIGSQSDVLNALARLHSRRTLHRPRKSKSWRGRLGGEVFATSPNRNASPFTTNLRRIDESHISRIYSRPARVAASALDRSHRLDLGNGSRLAGQSVGRGDRVCRRPGSAGHSHRGHKGGRRVLGRQTPAGPAVLRHIHAGGLPQRRDRGSRRVRRQGHSGQRNHGPRSRFCGRRRER